MGNRDELEAHRADSGGPSATPEQVLAGLSAYLQPIVSVRSREVRLVEALVRGQGRLRTPSELFGDATQRGYRIELERACRAAAFRAYADLGRERQPPVLSVNLDTTLVLQGGEGARLLVAEARAHGLHPSSIALEILESALPELAALEDFCRTARRSGFLLALDDVGTGHSNLGRVPRLEPDILKIDRELVHGMSQSFHRREVFRSLLSLAHQIGALAIAEGVEGEPDVRTGLALGCDLFQGFYFGRPMDPRSGAALYDAGRLLEAGEEFRASATRRLNDRRARQRRSEAAMRTVIAQLHAVAATDFDAVIRHALASTAFVEALYVLDERGIQITDTAHRVASSRQALFRPSTRGTDQSLKPYFLMMHAGLQRYTSEPYVSGASGNFCVTMSRHFVNVLGQGYLLCCDLIVQPDV